MEYLHFNKFFSITITICWMVLIFFLSHQPATESNELSTGIISLIESWFPSGFGLHNLNFIVRKGAHFSAYFILGLLVSSSLRKVGIQSFKLALLICVFYAISDEVHQVFIPGRSGEVGDVIIDSIGAFVGVVSYIKLRKRYKKGE